MSVLVMECEKGEDFYVDASDSAEQVMVKEGRVVVETDKKKRLREESGDGRLDVGEMREMMRSVMEMKEKMNEMGDVGKKMDLVVKGLMGLEKVSENIRRVFEVIEAFEVKVKGMEERMKEQNGEVKRLEEQVKKLTEKVEEGRGRERSVEGERSESGESEEWKKKYEVVEERLIDQEARGRRNNLLIHGLEESVNEDCVNIAKEFFRTKCRVSTAVTIERAHRIGGRRQTPGKPRPLIVRFLDYNHRQMVKEGRKHLETGLGVSDDLPREVRDARKHLYQEVRDAKARGKEAWISYPARLFVDGVLIRSVRPSAALSGAAPGHGGQGGKEGQGNGQGGSR